jgi:hypothetical protein
MRKSQIAVLAAAAAVILIIVGAIVGARIIVAQLGTGEYGGEPQRSEPRAANLASGDLDLSGFDRIDARGIWEVSLTQGPDWNVSLQYSDAIADELRVRVEGDRLVLGYDEHEGFSWWRGFGFGGHDRVVATITMPALEAIDLSGASEVNFSGFSGQTLDINASGAAEINGSDGSYEELALIVSGAGDVNLRDLVVDDARLVLSGATDATLNMNGGALSGTISGAGSVRYRGTVSEQNVVISGFSSVEPLN